MSIWESSRIVGISIRDDVKKLQKGTCVCRILYRFLDLLQIILKITERDNKSGKDLRQGVQSQWNRHVLKLKTENSITLVKGGEPNIRRWGVTSLKEVSYSLQLHIEWTYKEKRVHDSRELRRTQLTRVYRNLPTKCMIQVVNITRRPPNRVVLCSVT